MCPAKQAQELTSKLLTWFLFFHVSYYTILKVTRNHVTRVLQETDY